MKTNYNKQNSLCNFCTRADSTSYDCFDCVGACTLWEPNNTFKQELAKHGYKLTANIVKNTAGKKVQDLPINTSSDGVKTIVLICIPGCGQEKFVESLKNTKYKVAYYNNTAAVYNSICKRMQADIDDGYDFVIVETTDSKVRKAIHDDTYIMENSKIFAYHPNIDVLDKWLESALTYYTGKDFVPIMENAKKWVADIINEKLFFSIEYVCDIDGIAFSLYQTGIPYEKFRDVHHIYCEYLKSNK